MALFDNPPPPPIILNNKIFEELRSTLLMVQMHLPYMSIVSKRILAVYYVCFQQRGKGGSNGLTLGYYDDLQLNKTDLQFGFGTVFHFRFGGGWSTGARASGIDWLRLKIANTDPLEKLGIFKLLIKKFYQVLLKTKIFVIFHLVRFTAEGGSNDTVT